MLIVLSLVAAYGGWRVVKAAWGSLRGIPRDKEDWIYY